MTNHFLGPWVLGLLVASLSIPHPSFASPPGENSAPPSNHPQARSGAERLAAADPAGAIAACAAWTAPGPVHEEIGAEAAACRWIAAQAHAASGRWDQVEWLVRPVLGRLGPAAPWAHLLLGQALLHLGEEARAQEELELARAADLTGPLAREANRLLATAEDGGPTLVPPPLEELPWPGRLGELRRMLGIGEARQVLEALERLGPPPAQLQPEVLWLQARAFSDAGQREQAEGTLRILLTTDASDGMRRDARLLLGRLAARRGALDEALEHLDRAAAGQVGGVASEAAFLAAFLPYDFGKYPEAASRFSTYLRSHRHRADEAAWFRGWSLYLQGEWAEAAGALDTLLREHPRSNLVPQVLYWRARALEQGGRVDEARALYRDGARRWPTDWYGQWSQRRLGPESPRPPVSLASISKVEWKGAGLQMQRLLRARALYELGMLQPAGWELDAATAGAKDRHLLVHAAHLALEAGDPHRAFRLSTRLGGPGRAANLSYPRAFPGSVEEAAAASGLDPLLLLSIARQESGFSRDVRSPRGAVGVMQLLPITARRLVQRLGIELDPERLDDPGTNLRLGAGYLAALVQRFGGSEVLAIAAYNAGPGAVAGWLADPLRSELPLDEWVEKIPWRETRGYVKAVVSNHATYLALEGRAPPTLSLELPTPRDGIDF